MGSLEVCTNREIQILTKVCTKKWYFRFAIHTTSTPFCSICHRWNVLLFQNWISLIFLSGESWGSLPGSFSNFRKKSWSYYCMLADRFDLEIQFMLFSKFAPFLVIITSVLALLTSYHTLLPPSSTYNQQFLIWPFSCNSSKSLVTFTQSPLGLNIFIMYIFVSSVNNFFPVDLLIQIAMMSKQSLIGEFPGPNTNVCLTSLITLQRIKMSQIFSIKTWELAGGWTEDTIC